MSYPNLVSRNPPQKFRWFIDGPTHLQQRIDRTMAKKQKLLNDLFHEALKDIYFAEKKILSPCPKCKKRLGLRS